MTATPRKMPIHTTLTPILVGPEDPHVSMTLVSHGDGSLSVANRDGAITLTAPEVERLIGELAAPRIAAEICRLIGLER